MPVLRNVDRLIKGGRRGVGDAHSEPVPPPRIVTPMRAARSPGSGVHGRHYRGGRRRISPSSTSARFGSAGQTGHGRSSPLRPLGSRTPAGVHLVLATSEQVEYPGSEPRRDCRRVRWAPLHPCLIPRSLVSRLKQTVHQPSLVPASDPPRPNRPRLRQPGNESSGNRFRSHAAAGQGSIELSSAELNRPGFRLRPSQRKADQDQRQRGCRSRAPRQRHSRTLISIALSEPPGGPARRRPLSVLDGVLVSDERDGATIDEGRVGEDTMLDSRRHLPPYPATPSSVA
jgi:hypothetical protein